MEYKTLTYINEEGEEDTVQYSGNDMIISDNASSADIEKIEKLLGWKKYNTRDDELFSELYAKIGIDVNAEINNPSDKHASIEKSMEKLRTKKVNPNKDLEKR